VVAEQQDLFKKSTKQLEEEKYTNEYCLNYLRTSLDLWDMRTWRKNHDRKEVEDWVAQEEISGNNDGHAGFCVAKLKERGVIGKGFIVDAIMSNNHITYGNRIVPCFLEDCPKWVANGKKYGPGLCEPCESKVTPKGKRNATKAVRTAPVD
jgi:hypothetical protein